MPSKCYFGAECWCRTPLLTRATVGKNSSPALSDFQSSGLFQCYAWGKYQRVSMRASKSLNPDQGLESTPTVYSCGHMPPLGILPQQWSSSRSVCSRMCVCIYSVRRIRVCARVSYSAHGGSEAVGEFTQRAQVLLEALQLGRRSGRGWALLRGSRKTNLLLSPQTGACHQQQITQ